VFYRVNFLLCRTAPFGASSIDTTTATSPRPATQCHGPGKWRNLLRSSEPYRKRSSCNTTHSKTERVQEGEGESLRIPNV